MNRHDIKEALLAAVREEDGKKRLTCAEALRVAADCAVPPKVIGEICDQEGIKIRSCELGCF